MADTTNYGWTKPTVNADVDTWGGIANTAFDDIDADLKTVSDNSKNASNLTSGTVPAARGGAGTANGILKANGSGTVSAATPSVDYCPASSGSSILYGNGSGGLSNVTIGSGLTFSGGTLSATGAVTSVAGRTGAVTLSNSDISGLGSLATSSNSNALNAGSNALGTRTVSTSSPSGTPSDGDIWVQYS